MLVLTRRVNETIKIGNDVVIHIFGMTHGQVKIGISAPKEINIVRDDCKKDRQKNLIHPEKKEDK